MITWSGRLVDSTGQELGMEELGPLTFRYVLRDPPDEGQEGPMAIIDVHKEEAGA